MNLNFLKKAKIEQKENKKRKLTTLKLSIMKEIKEREISSMPYFQPQIKNLDCQKEKITAFLIDGRELSIPTTWFARLRNATLE